jgi:hypothetical protein
MMCNRQNDSMKRNKSDASGPSIETSWPREAIGAPAQLLDLLAKRLAAEPLTWAGAYGGRFGGWSSEDSDLDLVLVWPTLEIFYERGELIKEDLRAIAVGFGLELDFAQGAQDSFFEPGAPETNAFFFVGPTLAGDPQHIAAPEVLELARRADNREQCARLAAAKRATRPLASIEGWSQFDPDREQIASTLEELAIAFGYLARRGKDRRVIRDQVEDFAALLTGADRQLALALFERSLAETDPRAQALVRRAAQTLRDQLAGLTSTPS